MNALLEAVRTVAREDEAEISTYSTNLADVDQAVSEKNRARITQRILRMQATPQIGQATVQVSPKTTATAAAAAATILRIDGGQVPPDPRRQRRIFLAATGGLIASAAGLAIWLRPTAYEMLVPRYTIMASGGEKDTRGGPNGSSGENETTTAAQRLGVESELVIAIRPDTAVSGPVGARAFLVQGQAIAEPRATIETAPSGAIELRFRGAELVRLGHGPAIIRVVVGRLGALRALDPRAISSTVTSTPELRVLTVPVELVLR